MKMNCWEAKGCGRHPGGENEKEFGTCPAAIEQKVHGVNSGVNAGRACWVVSGTLCGGQVQGAFATKLGNCLQCDFYQAVRDDEGRNFTPSKEIIARLN